MLREFSAGGVVYKKEKGEVLWFVTKSTPSEVIPQSRWRLPKGRLDDNGDSKTAGPLGSGKKKATEEQIKDAALREVGEEGGIAAKIVEKIGTEKYFFNLGEQKYLKFVTFYLMEWVADLPEGFDFETSEVAWLTFPEARKRLSYSNEKKILDKAKELLK